MLTQIARFVALVSFVILWIAAPSPSRADDTPPPPTTEESKPADAKPTDAKPADAKSAQAPPKKRREMFPNLARSLRETPGALKAQYANTPDGKLCIFGWFEDKEGAKTWYHSATHQGLLNTFFPNRIEREPMFLVPDDIGPMMGVACFTPPKEPGQSIRQISVELYAPLHGGFSANGRFGPDEWKDIYEHYDQYEHTEEYRQRMREQVLGRSKVNPVTDVPMSVLDEDQPSEASESPETPEPSADSETPQSEGTPRP